MKNTPIDPYAAQEIQEIVARVLREVSPEPPLNTDEVLNRLKLDLHYFSLTDPSLRQEMVHRVEGWGTVGLAKKSVPRACFPIAEKSPGVGVVASMEERLRRDHPRARSHQQRGSEAEASMDQGSRDRSQPHSSPQAISYSAIPR